MQHKSGQGEKWLLWECPRNHGTIDTWYVVRDGQDDLYLPKSEYVLCEPSEQWRDVTFECEFREMRQEVMHCANGGVVPITNTLHGYRFRKVQLISKHLSREDLPILLGACNLEMCNAFLVEKFER